MSLLPKTPGPSRRRWAFPLSILLAGFFLYYALRGVDWAGVANVIAGMRWQYVLIGTCLTCVALFLRSLRWRVLLNAEGDFDVWTVFAANMAGYLGNNFLPARAGEVVRSVLISGRSRLTKAYVLTTALSERVVDVIALVLAGSLALLSVSPKPQWLETASRTMTLLAAVAALAAVLLPRMRPLARRLLDRLPLPRAIGAWLARLLDQVVLGLRAFHDRGRFTKFVLLTGAVWLSDAGATVVGGAALGLHVSWTAAVLVLAGLGFGAALPATPGNVGIYQFVMVSTLGLFGTSRDGALAFALVSQLTGYLVTLALGLPSLYALQGSGLKRSPRAPVAACAAPQVETPVGR